MYIVQPVLDEKFLVPAMYCLGCKCGVYGMYFGIYIGMYFGMYIGQLTTRATRDVYCLGWAVIAVAADCKLDEPLNHCLVVVRGDNLYIGMSIVCDLFDVIAVAADCNLVVRGDNLCNLSYETPSSDNTTGQKKRWA